MHLKAIFTVAFALFITSNVFGQQTITGSFMNGGVQRSYIVYIPAMYSGTEAVPLLLNFHGYTSNAQQQQFYSNFMPIADTAGFIMVLPEGTVDSNGNTHFNVGWGASSVDDVAFTSALIDTLSATYNLDQNRVYSTGMSNGGFMSFKLACELSSRIAAIGSVTGSMTLGTIPTCNASHPMPVLQIHGTSDQTVAYNGSAFSTSVPDVIDFWSDFSNTTSTTTEDLPDLSTTDGSTVQRIWHEGGDNCTEVVHYKVNGGSHTWPGAAFDLGGTNYDISASTLVWNFVSQYDLNGKIDCATSSIDEANSRLELTVYPNPSSSAFTIKGLIEPAQFELISVLGATVLSGKVSATSNTIAISDLNKGVYFLKVEGLVFELVVE